MKQDFSCFLQNRHRSDCTCGLNPGRLEGCPNRLYNELNSDPNVPKTLLLRVCCEASNSFLPLIYLIKYVLKSAVYGEYLRKNGLPRTLGQMNWSCQQMNKLRHQLKLWLRHMKYSLNHLPP